jgi:hypothetical protein
LVQRAEENLIQVEAEVAEALLLENESRPPNTALLNSQIAAEWGEGVTLLELHMDTALVDVVINQPSETWHNQPYRVARVLRQDGKGWQLIEPVNRFWSDRRTLETAYFDLSYGRRDEGVLQEVAAELDAAYLQMHTDLALPQPARGELVPIRIALVEGSSIRVTDLSYSGDTLIIPPSDLIPRPLAMSNAEALRQAITYSLAVKLFVEAQEQYATPCLWNAVADGVGLWLRWEGHTLPSRRRWLYENMLSEWKKPSSVPRLDDLLSFPLSCSRPPTILEAEIRNSGRPIPRQELASTLIEYMVATHGRQFVPQMLRDLDEFTDWDDFAQRSIGTSAQELEAGWQAYLRDQAP